MVFTCLRVEAAGILFPVEAPVRMTVLRVLEDARICHVTHGCYGMGQNNMHAPCYTSINQQWHHRQLVRLPIASVKER